MKSRVLLILPTNTYQAASFLAAAEELGVEVVVASEQPQALDRVVANKTLTVDLVDLDAAVRSIEKFHQEWPLNAVVGVDDHTALLAARAGETLALPGSAVDAVRAAGDKHLMRCRLRDAGLRTPQFVLFGADAGPVLERAPDFPCVLKPVRLAASRGVIRANDEAEFVAGFERIRRILSYPGVAERSGAEADRILVETYIPGGEVALEGLLMDGKLQLLALFDKPDPLEGPYFAETIYVTPSRLAPPLQQELAAAAAEGAKALGLTEGPLHAELRFNDDGVWIVEVAARTIGGLCARTLQFGAHISLEELVLRHALGREVSTHRVGGASGVMMIPVPRRGVLRAVEGLETAGALPAVEEIVISVAMGTPVEPLPEGDRYLGFIFARDRTPEAVEGELRAAFNALSVTIE
jgi:biotin carboxylase